MAVLADYTNLTDTNLSAAQLNSRFQALWNLLGFTTQILGTLDYTNLSATAALRPSQVADTSMVLDTAVSGVTAQTVNKGTRFDAGSFRCATTANNRETLSQATTPAYAVVSRTFWKVIVATGALTMTTLTGAAEGDVVSIYVDNSGSAGTFTLTHTTANTANTFRLKSGTSRTMATLLRGTMGTFVFGSPGGEANSQWHEI